MNDDPMDIFMCVKLGRFYDLVCHRTSEAEIWSNLVQLCFTSWRLLVCNNKRWMVSYMDGVEMSQNLGV